MTFFVNAVLLSLLKISKPTPSFDNFLPILCLNSGMIKPENKLQINCDLGEGIANEPDIIPWIDAASVACGGHFGDKESIYRTLSSCKTHDKKSGAHPSYPDRENFGRKTIRLPKTQLLDSLWQQIDLFLDVAKTVDIPMDHIKFHGALYNDAANEPELAETLCLFLFTNYPNVPVFIPPFSAMESAAKKQGIHIKLEIFGDRGYSSDFRLLPRSIHGSLLTRFEEIDKHLDSLFNSSCLISTDGTKLPVQADTICFHGDNPGILGFLPQIRKKWWS